jgi:hypothetical protein
MGMASILEWLEDYWGDWGWSRKRSEVGKLKEWYRSYRSNAPEPLPRVRPRRISISRAQYPQSRNSATSPQSRLLGLPVELRLLIWEHAFGGNVVALYRDRNRLTHTLLDDTNSHTTKRHLTVSDITIQDAVMLLPENSKMRVKESTHSSKLAVIPLLQSCRAM